MSLSENFIPLKNSNIRIYNKNGIVCAADLEFGRNLLFTDFEKQVFMLCTGDLSVCRIAAKLEVSAESVLKTVEKFIDKNLIIFKKTPVQDNFRVFTKKIDCAAVFKEGADFDNELLCIEKLISDSESHKECCPHKIIVYLCSLNWKEHSASLISFFERFINKEEFCFNLPFSVVCETDSLPGMEDFLAAETDFSSESEVIKNLSALGKLWCILHLFNAQIMLVKAPEYWMLGVSGAVSSERQSLQLKNLEPAAAVFETASMLYTAAADIWKCPKPNAGHYFMEGISIMPVICAEKSGWSESLKSLYKLGVKALGIKVPKSGADYSQSEAFKEELLSVFDFICEVRSLGDAFCVYPIERLRQEVCGTWKPRMSQSEFKSKCRNLNLDFPNRCRRCAAWHYCLNSEESAEPLECSIVRALTEKVLYGLTR